MFNELENDQIVISGGRYYKVRVFRRGDSFENEYDLTMLKLLTNREKRFALQKEEVVKE